MIPKIIHQTWKCKEIPPIFKKYQQWEEKMPDWEILLWTDDENESLVKNHFPWFYDTYKSLEFKIQKVDAIRYCYLYKYGGIYADLDIECINSLDKFIEMAEKKEIDIAYDNLLYTYPGIILSEEWLFSSDYNITKKYYSAGKKEPTPTISNSIMISEKNHPFWLICLHEIMEEKRENYINIEDFENFKSFEKIFRTTGPNFLYNTYQKYKNNFTNIVIIPHYYLQCCALFFQDENKLNKVKSYAKDSLIGNYFFPHHKIKKEILYQILDTRNLRWCFFKIDDKIKNSSFYKYTFTIHYSTKSWEEAKEMKK